MRLLFFAAAEPQAWSQMIIFCQLSHAHHNRISCYGGQKSDSYQIISSNFSTPIKSKRVRRPWSNQIFALYTLKRSCQKSVSKVLIVLFQNHGELSALSSVCSGAQSKQTQKSLRKAKPTDRLLHFLLSVTASYSPTTLNSNLILCSGVLEVPYIYVI